MDIRGPSAHGPPSGEAGRGYRFCLEPKGWDGKAIAENRWPIEALLSPRPYAAVPAFRPLRQGARKFIPGFAPRKRLKSRDSDERFQASPRECNPHGRAIQPETGPKPRKPKSKTD